MTPALILSLSFLTILSTALGVQTGNKKPVVSFQKPIRVSSSPSTTSPSTPRESSFPYYYDPRIHNFGNIGTIGMFHAEISPMVTRLIDRMAYNGEDVRKNILKQFVGKKTHLDLACGTGTSTTPHSIGVDTSPAMLLVAKRYYPLRRFVFGNAETYGKNKEYDVVTCMFAFHEMPIHAHKAVIKNAIRVAKKEVIIVDISPAYKPSQTMLTGEPYALQYLATISSTCRSFGFKEHDHIPDRVTVWRLKL